MLSFVCILCATSAPCAERTTLISRGFSGGPGNGNSEDPSISASGRYVVYESTAKNLVTDKTTSNRDVFLYDRIAGTTMRISKPAGEEGNSSSYDPEISSDGNVIVFTSQASNLVENDTEGNGDIFAYDRTTDTLSRVSVNSSGDGADDDCDHPDVSADGRYVVFQSAATNLVVDDTNEKVDVFRHDRITGETVRVSFDFLDQEVEDYDSEEPVISNDGRYIAFQTRAELIPCDDNDGTDIYVRDMVQGLTTHASTTYYGCVPNSSSYHPSITGDGRFVSFHSSATNLTLEDDDNHKNDLFIRDRELSNTERISIATNGREGDERSVGYGGNMSSDGRYVAFSSAATTFVEDDNDGHDVFIRDRQDKETTREGVGTYWEEGTGSDETNVAVLSADGKFVAFDSHFDGLVPDDNNGYGDIFLREYLWDKPLVTAISPTTGDLRGGTLLTITGENFDAAAAVTIDGQTALNIVVNPSGTMITCVTPPHTPGSVELTVTNEDGMSWIYPIGRGLFKGYLYRPLALPFLKLLNL